MARCWDDHRDAQKALESPNEMYKQVGVDFNNWLEDYDSTLMTGFEEYEAGVAGRGVWNSGPATTQVILYFQEFRRKRDNKIDSFLVAYSLAGGDTIGLSYSRKLTVDVQRIIDSRWGNMFDRLGQPLQSYRLDTL